MRWHILGAKIEKNNLNTGNASNCGLPWFWNCTWTVCVHNHLVSNLCINYVSSVLCILQTITKDEFVNNVIQFQL
jgi:hypothetical protein